MIEIHQPDSSYESSVATTDVGDAADRADLVARAEALVKNKMALHDPSHDWLHVDRVRQMALTLMGCASLGDKDVDVLVVQLGALFHDLCDAKYASTVRDLKAPVTAVDVLSGFFAPFVRDGSITQAQVDLVYRIVDNVSWSKEEARRQRMDAGGASERDTAQQAWEDGCAEFKCVSDADRLDAIGAIGIFRAGAYSAVRKRPLYLPPANAASDPVPPAEQATGYNGSAVAHFHEKLLKIRGDRLKTNMARQEAERRQTVLQWFLDQLHMEWLLAHQGAQLALLS